MPGGLVMTPDGKAAYVLEPFYGVVAVDLATRAALGLIKIPGARSFALTPDGKTLYVLATVGKGLTLTAIGTATNTTIATVALHGPALPAPTQSHPAGWYVGQSTLTMAPNGKTVYVSYQSVRVTSAATSTTRWSGSIIAVDVASDTELKPIDMGPVPGRVAQEFLISPGSQTGYLTDSNLSTQAQWVSPVDLRTDTVLPSIALPAAQNGYQLSLSPGGATLYATAVDGSTVVPVDTATDTARQPIRLGSFPRWQQYQGVFAPGGDTLYVLSSFDYPKGALIAGRMTPVDTATGAVGKPINFPEGLDDIVFGR